MSVGVTLYKPHSTIKIEVSEKPRQFALSVAATLHDAGYAVFFAGGCVRDRILGKPVKDYDIATSAIPERVLELFPEGHRVGAHFGVVVLRAGECSVEVATFRADGEYRDGRRPQNVSYETDPRQDVMRRDFTINGLLEDPLSGEVSDFVGGQADLRAGLIRAIGDPARRFAEDHLRMLRAVRFAARLGFRIESQTFEAIRADPASILRISAERIRDEISRILTEGGARRGFEMLDSTGLLAQILPEVAAMKGVEQPPDFHPEGDVWTHTLLVLEHLPASPSLPLALAALLHDVAKPVTQSFAGRIRFHGHDEKGAEMTRDILTRLRYPNDVIERVASHVELHMRFKDIPQMRESRLKRFLRSPHFDELLELHRSDRLGSLKDLSSYHELRAKLDSVEPEGLRPAPLINGDDVIALGCPPGPRLGSILRDVEDAQLEGAVHNRGEALALAKSLLARSGKA
jgi:poly(A) polymerase